MAKITQIKIIHYVILKMNDFTCFQFFIVYLLIIFKRQSVFNIPTYIIQYTLVIILNGAHNLYEYKL